MILSKPIRWLALCALALQRPVAGLLASDVLEHMHDFNDVDLVKLHVKISEALFTRMMNGRDSVFQEKTTSRPKHTTKGRSRADSEAAAPARSRRNSLAASVASFGDSAAGAERDSEPASSCKPTNESYSPTTRFVQGPRETATSARASVEVVAKGLSLSTKDVRQPRDNKVSESGSASRASSLPPLPSSAEVSASHPEKKLRMITGKIRRNQALDALHKRGKDWAGFYGIPLLKELKKIKDLHNGTLLETWIESLDESQRENIHSWQAIRQHEKCQYYKRWNEQTDTWVLETWLAMCDAFRMEYTLGQLNLLHRTWISLNVQKRNHIIKSDSWTLKNYRNEHHKAPPSLSVAKRKAEAALEAYKRYQP